MHSTIFLGQKVTSQQIITALQKFDSQYLKTNDYDSWLEKGTYRYAVQDQNKLYPCKFILSLAVGIELSLFGGGKQTNKAFENLGFDVIEKPSIE